MGLWGHRHPSTAGRLASPESVRWASWLETPEEPALQFKAELPLARGEANLLFPCGPRLIQ